VSALPALSITRDVLQNSYYKDVLAEASVSVEKGRPLSEAFIRHSNVFPIIFSEMIAVGEETGQHSQMLLRVAEFYEAEVEQKTKDISTIIEPFLMLAIGGGVGFFAVAMITPIYSISSGI
jgi:type IV pilus assembly protein PilC